MIGELLRGEPEFLRVLGAAARLAFYLAALGAAGTALYGAAFGRRVAPEEGSWLRRATLASAAVGGAAAFAWLAVQVALASDGNPLDGEIWSLMIGMPPGRSVLVAVAGLALVGVAGWLGPARPGAQVVGGVVLAASFALVGHTTATVPRVLFALLLVVHLLGVAFWAGSLVPLARASRGEPRAAAAFVEDWARTASWLVGGLVVAGLALSWAIVGSLGVLFGTRYGWALLAKVALVGVVFAFVVWHRFRLTPDLAAGRPGAGRRLARSIGWEAAAMVLVFWAASELTATSPMGDG